MNADCVIIDQLSEEARSNDYTVNTYTTKTLNLSLTLVGLCDFALVIQNMNLLKGQGWRLNCKIIVTVFVLFSVFL